MQDFWIVAAPHEPWWGRPAGRLDARQRVPAAGAWLRTVATNLSLNHLARHRSRWRFFADFPRREGEPSGEPDIPAPESVEAEMDKADRCAFVEEALQRLPAAQRVPLVLYHFQGLAYDEIAAKLGVSLAKVKTDIHRGRETLRKRLRARWHADVPPFASL